MADPSDNSNEEIVVRLDPLIKDIVGDFLQRRRENASNILAALAESDLETVDQIGHDLEGTAGAFGFSDMAILGHSLQQAAKQSNPEEVKRLAEELIDYLNRLKVVYK